MTLQFYALLELFFPLYCFRFRHFSSVTYFVTYWQLHDWIFVTWSCVIYYLNFFYMPNNAFISGDFNPIYHQFQLMKSLRILQLCSCKGSSCTMRWLLYQSKANLYPLWCDKSFSCGILMYLGYLTSLHLQSFISEKKTN